MKIWKPEEIKWDNPNSEEKVSEPLVMASAAGWYVGQVFTDLPPLNFIMPYSRLSGYYDTPEEAEEALISDQA
jgi:hypothetical protein